MDFKVQERLEKIRREGYELDFGTALNDAFEIFKKTFLWTALTMIVLGIAGLFVAVIVLIGVFGAETLANNPEALSLIMLDPTYLAIYFVSMTLLSAIATPISAGLIEMAHRADRGLPFGMGTVFHHYSSGRFWPLFTLGLTVAVISLAFSMGIEMLHFPGYAAVNFFFSLTFGLFTLMAIPLCIFANGSAFESLGGSLLIVSKQFWIILGLYFVAIIMAILGVFLCIIGIFFTLAITYAMIYSIYKNSVGVIAADENRPPFFDID